MKITSYSPIDDATNWYRVKWPLQSLAEKGLCEFQMHFGEDCSLNLDSNLAVFQRTGLTHLPLMKEYKQNRIPVVYDLDDDLPNLDPSNPANMIVSPKREVAARHHQALLSQKNMAMIMPQFLPFLEMKTSDVAEMAIRNFNAIIQSMKTANLVTVSTDSLRKTYRSWGVKNIRVLPNQEKLSEWKNVIRAPLLNRVVLGWAGGISHAFTDIEPIKRPVTRILKENPNVHLHLIGVAELGKFFDESEIKDRVFVESWKSWEDLKSIIAEFDITLAPSYAQKRFSEGKSDIRCLQSWMVGVPVVASPLTYRESVQESGGGLIAEFGNEWYAALSLLVKNGDLRRELGAKGRRYALENRIYEGCFNLWADTYQELVQSKAKQ